VNLPHAPDTYNVMDQVMTRAEIEREDNRNRKNDQDIELAQGLRCIFRDSNGVRWALSISTSGVVSAVLA